MILGLLRIFNKNHFILHFYVYLAGIFSGTMKTDKDSIKPFLKKVLIEPLLELETGVTVQRDNQATTLHIKLSKLICDKPAKSICMDFIYFNGYYSCYYCEEKGKLKFSLPLAKKIHYLML